MKLSLPQFPEVKGIFVGGCIERGEGSSFRAKAHAHNSTKDPYFGWICVRSWCRIGTYAMNKDGDFDGSIVKSNMLILHETAHIKTPNHGHDDKWRDMVHQIGGRLSSWEKKYKTGNWRNRRVWTLVGAGVDAQGMKFRDERDERGAYRRVYITPEYDKDLNAPVMDGVAVKQVARN